MSSTSRKITALVRWGISAWVLAAIVTQIWSEVANDAFYPERYFSYFTIQSSLINIVAFAAGAYAVQLSKPAARAPYFNPQNGADSAPWVLDIAELQAFAGPSSAPTLFWGPNLLLYQPCAASSSGGFGFPFYAVDGNPTTPATTLPVQTISTMVERLNTRKRTVTALTVIWCSANSNAMAWVNPTTPNFDAT